MSRRELILKRIVDEMEGTSPSSEVYLYGSRARGTAKRLSDWDVLVLLNTDTISFEFETGVMNRFYEIELETGAVISPLIYTKQDWESTHCSTPLYANIQKEGVRIK